MSAHETSSRRLARILSDAGALSDEDIITIQDKFPDEYLGEVLVRERILLPEYLRSLLIRVLHIPWIEVDGCTVPQYIADLLPEVFCREKRVMPISSVRKILTLACANPLDEEVLNEVRSATNLNVRLVLCSSEQLESLLQKVFVKAAPEGSEADPAWDAEGGDKVPQEDNAPSAEVSAMAKELASQLDEGAKPSASVDEEEGKEDES